MEKELIKEIEENENKSTEIRELAKYKLEFWNKVKSTAKEYPTVIIEAYYELIKELLTALMNKDGFKSETHDCLFYYIEERHKDLELDFEFLHELRKARNSINYRGTKMPKNAWKELELKVDLTIKYLVKILE